MSCPLKTTGIVKYKCLCILLLLRCRIFLSIFQLTAIKTLCRLDTHGLQLKFPNSKTVCFFLRIKRNARIFLEWIKDTNQCCHVTCAQLKLITTKLIISFVIDLAKINLDHNSERNLVCLVNQVQSRVTVMRFERIEQSAICSDLIEDKFP